MAIDLGDIPTGTPPTAPQIAQMRTALGLGTGDSPAFTGITLGTSGILIGGVNLLFQRNGTNAQNSYVANTYTDASNYERGVFGFTSNVLRIGTEILGTGVARAIDFVTGGTARWGISAAGHLLATADNTYDIGASGATRPRNVHAGTSIIAGTSMWSPSAFIGNTFANPYCRFSTNAVDGQLTLTNSTDSSFGRLNFGGTSTSFPALKRSSAILQGRLANDSAFCVIQATLRTSANAVAETPTATHTIVIQDATGTAYRVLALV